MLTDALIEKMVADADTMARKFVGVAVAPQSMIRKLTQAKTRLGRSDGRITLLSHCGPYAPTRPSNSGPICAPARDGFWHL